MAFLVDLAYPPEEIEGKKAYQVGLAYLLVEVEGMKAFLLEEIHSLDCFLEVEALQAYLEILACQAFLAEDILELEEEVVEPLQTRS